MTRFDDKREHERFDLNASMVYAFHDSDLFDGETPAQGFPAGFFALVSSPPERTTHPNTAPIRVIRRGLDVMLHPPLVQVTHRFTRNPATAPMIGPPMLRTSFDFMFISPGFGSMLLVALPTENIRNMQKCARFPRRCRETAGNERP